MKRLICSILCLALLFACFTPALAEQSFDVTPAQTKANSALQKRISTALSPDWSWLKNERVGRGDSDYDNNIYYQFSLDKPSFINIEMFTFDYGTMLFLENIDNPYGSISGGKHFNQRNYLYKMGAYINPGNYYIRVSGLDEVEFPRLFKDSARFDIRFKLREVTGLSNPEAGNNSYANAYPISFGNTVNAMMGSGDEGEHFYRFHLLEDAKVKLTFKLYKKQFNAILYRVNGEEDPIKCTEIRRSTQPALSKAKNYSKTVSLSAGEYAILISNTYASNDDGEIIDIPRASRNGLYDLTITNTGIPTAKLKLPASVNVTVGFTNASPVKVSMSPSWFPAPTDLVYTLSSTARAEISTGGLLTGIKLGETNLTVHSQSNPNLRATTKVKVLENAFTGGKPVYIKDELNLSRRRMYMKGNYLYVEMYVANRTGSTVSSMGNVTARLFNSTNELFIDTPAWEKMSLGTLTIPNKGYRLLTARFARSAIDGRYDLRTGIIDVVGDVGKYRYKGKSINRKLSPSQLIERYKAAQK